jgi:hypothetical protein
MRQLNFQPSWKASVTVVELRGLGWLGVGRIRDFGFPPIHLPPARKYHPRHSSHGIGKRGSRSDLQYTGGKNNQGVTPPIGWLENYWKGKYYGITEAPKLSLLKPVEMARVPLNDGSKADTAWLW